MVSGQWSVVSDNFFFELILYSCSTSTAKEMVDESYTGIVVILLTYEPHICLMTNVIFYSYEQGELDSSLHLRRVHKQQNCSTTGYVKEVCVMVK